MEEHSYLQHPELNTNLLPLAIIVIFSLVYVILTFYKSGERKWNKWRTFSFLFGMFLLLIALHPSTLNWAHVDIRGHMYQHLLLGMYAPIFLVLAAPVTLILAVLPVGFARRMTYILKTSFFKTFYHPFTAVLLNIGGMYLLYLTPLYNLSLGSTYIHNLIHLHFLLAGYLFTWAIIGPDFVPGRPRMKIRLLALFLSIGAHSYLSKLMYAYLYPVNSPHAQEQIQEAAKIMYYWGDISELLLIIIVFYNWYYSRNSMVRQETIAN